jgi:mannose-6-phosphate isomerase-like protein (cupin superfamily)
MIKNETWYVQSGSFEFHYIDTEHAKRVRNIIKTGDVVYIQKGLPHQLVAMEDNSVVFEVSTEHFDNDSYRIYRESHFDLK